MPLHRPDHREDQDEAPQVSVVVPAYNAAATISLCLKALVAQEYPVQRLEIIVVDDGSTDQTAAIVRPFSVRYLHQHNQGPAAARNAGAALAKGELLLFTDADCVPAANWVAEMVAAFRLQEVMAVKGAYRTNQRQLVARFVQIEFEERFALLEKAGTTDMVDTYSAGYRAAVFAELGGFDTRFPVANNEDTELSYRLAARGLRMVFNPLAIVYHLNHPDSLWRYARLKFSRGYWRMLVYRRFPAKMLGDTYTPKSLKIQIVLILALLASLPLPFVLGGWGFGLPILALICFVAACWPFILTAFAKDRVVGLCSPCLLAVRALALGLGAVCGGCRGRL